MVALMFLLTGISMGGRMADPESLFTQVIGSSLEYLAGRIIATFMMTLGHAIFALHFLLMLLRVGQPGGTATIFETHDEH